MVVVVVDGAERMETVPVKPLRSTTSLLSNTVVLLAVSQLLTWGG